MFCTRCGTELREQDKFCFNCAAATARGVSAPRPAEPLSRPMHEAKIAGVCAGFARYLGMDVTLVRVLWVVLTRRTNSAACACDQRSGRVTIGLDQVPLG
jgi:phage shock protein C